jgi:GDP-D-mannose dehydratase
VRRELGWAPSKDFAAIVEEMVQADIQLLKQSG